MNLRTRLIRLAHQNPHLRADLLPLLAQSKQAADANKVDPAVIAEAQKVVDEIDALVASMKRLAQKLGKKVDQAETELEKQRKEFGDDPPIQDALEKYSSLFKMFDPSREGSVTYALNSRNIDIKREMKR